MTASLKLFKYKVEITKKVDNKEGKNNESSDEESEVSDQDDKKGLENTEKIENECDNIIKLIKDIIKGRNFSYIFEKYFLD